MKKIKCKFFIKKYFLLLPIFALCFMGFYLFKPTLYQFPVIPHFPKMPVSVNNTVTNEGVELGRFLFYDPILKWFVNYFTHPNPQTIIEFKFDYINSSSQKRIIEIILKIQQLNPENKNTVSVHWFYRADDEDMLEKGEEFAEYFSIPFKFISN